MAKITLLPRVIWSTLREYINDMFTELYSTTSNKVDIVPGKSLVDDTLITEIHAPHSDDQDISGKVDKIAGKGLSTNDYTDVDKTKVSHLSGENTGDQDITGKVDKVSGKGLSTNDFTNADASELTDAYVHSQSPHAPPDANHYVHPATHPATMISEDTDHRFVTDVEKVAWYTGNQVNSDWNANSGKAQILNKPGIPTTLAELSDDSTHRVVTDEEKAIWSSTSGVGLGETSTTAYRGDRGKIAYEHSQSTHAPTNAQKNSDITEEEINAKIGHEYKNIQSTGLVTGGIITPTVGETTKIDIGPGSAKFINNYTDPLHPVVVSYTWNTISGLTVDYLNTDPTTYIRIDSAGNITQSPNEIADVERRSILELGWVDHPDNTTITFCWNEPYFGNDLQSQLNDFFNAFKQFNIEGNEYTAYSGLTIQRSAGRTFDNNSNYAVDPRDPHIITTELETTCPIYYYNKVVGGWKNDNDSVTNIDPNHYDDGTGTLHNVTTGYWTIQVIGFYAVYDSTDIQYGQAEYATYEETIANIKTPIVINPYNNSDTFRAWLIVQQGCTDLTNASTAKFRSAGMFGMNDAGSGSIGGSGGEVNLASNIGLSGVGLYSAKSGVTLQFKNIDKSTGSVITVTNNPTNKTVEIGITEDATHRFVTDTEKTTWNAKQPAGAYLVAGDIANKVDKITGKDLSTNDYTTAEQTKLGNIEAGATVGADWDTNVAHKPTIPAAQVKSDWTASGTVAEILNKPNIPTALADLSSDTTHRVVTDAQITSWNSAGGVDAGFVVAMSVAL